jgi:glycine oxidase
MSRCDVLVVGGGIIGASLAEELARRGRRVALLERGTVGAEASSAAAGILSAQMDLSEPGPLFELCQAARRMYPRWVEHLERRSGISVGYQVNGILYVACSSKEEHVMRRRMRWQLKRGLRVERWSGKDVKRQEPALDGRMRCGFFFPTEAQVDNVALMRALALACRKAGVHICEHTLVKRLLVREQAVRGVETDRETLEAPVVVNCLGSWAALDGTFPTALPVEPVRGQMLAFQAPRRLLRHTVMSEQAYAVQRRDGRLLVGSTLERAGFEKALTYQGMHGILSGMRQLISALDGCTFLEAWAGLRPCTSDKLPILGSAGVEGLFVAVGHFRHGILLAPMTAHLMAELIVTHHPSDDLAPFSPHRFH